MDFDDEMSICESTVSAPSNQATDHTSVGHTEFGSSARSNINTIPYLTSQNIAVVIVYIAVWFGFGAIRIV